MTFTSIHDVRKALENPEITARQLAAALGNRLTARAVRKARQNQTSGLNAVAAAYNARHSQTVAA